MILYIERNDCLEVTATYMKQPYKKPEIYRPKRPLYKKPCVK